MTEWMIVVGGGEIGEALVKIILNRSEYQVLLFDAKGVKSEKIQNSQRVRVINLTVTSKTVWSSHLRQCVLIKALYMVAPSTNPRRPQNVGSIFGIDKHAFFEQVCGLNLAFLNLIEALADKLTVGSNIVMISSVLGSRVAEADASIEYHLSKSVCEALCRLLAVKLSPNTSVNAIAPGLIARTPDHPLLTDYGLSRAVQSSTPMRKPAIPFDIANACWILGSGQLAYITGQVISIDGGAGILETFSVAKLAQN